MKHPIGLAFVLACTLAAQFVSPVAAVATTPDNPYRVKDIGPNELVQPLVAVDNRVFFGADDGIHGRELYVSDGSVAGTYMVKDLNAGSASSLDFSQGDSNPDHWTAVGGLLFFVARDGRPGRALYVTDGSDAGTVRLMRRIPCDAQSLGIVKMGSRIVFASGNGSGRCDLYVSDGTVTGTVMVASNINAFRTPTAFKGRIFFVADNASGEPTLYKSDLAPGSIVRRIRSFLSPVYETAVARHRLFLSVGGRLWRSDGTRAGTDPMLAKSYNVQFLTPFQGDLYFQAWTYAPGTERGGNPSLWRSNGRKAGTVMIKDFGTTKFSGISTPGILATSKKMFFNAAQDIPTLGLWMSDGTSAGTKPAAQAVIWNGVGFGGDLYASGCPTYADDTGLHCTTASVLLHSDGSTGFTEPVDGPIWVYQVAATTDSIYLSNWELWRYMP